MHRTQTLLRGAAPAAHVERDLRIAGIGIGAGEREGGVGAAFRAGAAGAAFRFGAVGAARFFVGTEGAACTECFFLAFFSFFFSFGASSSSS